jgi:hypothetical protein
MRPSLSVARSKNKAIIRVAKLILLFSVASGLAARISFSWMSVSWIRCSVVDLPDPHDPGERYELPVFDREAQLLEGLLRLRRFEVAGFAEVAGESIVFLHVTQHGGAPRIDSFIRERVR